MNAQTKTNKQNCALSQSSLNFFTAFISALCIKILHWNI